MVFMWFFNFAASEEMINLLSVGQMGKDIPQVWKEKSLFYAQILCTIENMKCNPYAQMPRIPLLIPHCAYFP